VYSLRAFDAAPLARVPVSLVTVELFRLIAGFLLLMFVIALSFDERAIDDSVWAMPIGHGENGNAAQCGDI
jgi:hypothetical protein